MKFKIILTKIYTNIRLFFTYLFYGLKNADNIAFNAQKNNLDNNIGGIEQQAEENNVIKDLLKGELTQDVIELRHEMYFAERASHNFVYTGNGTAKKMNNLYSFSKESIEQEDGNKIILVQPNNEDPETLAAYGIDPEKDNNNIKDWDYGTKKKRNFDINIERDFIPRYALEKYTTQLVLKETNTEGKYIIDLYVSMYRKQFDNIQKMFLKQIENIYIGNTQNDILDFKTLWFITANAIGEPNSIYYEFDKPIFDNIIKFNGSYILRFVMNLVEKHDMLDDIYDKKTDNKIINKERRKNSTYNATIDLTTTKIKDDYDIDEAKKLYNNFLNNN